MAKKEPEDKINTIVEAVQKDYGKDSLRRGFTGGIIACSVVSTGCLSLDLALGVGGLPRGRIIEVFGPESSGKTTLALTAVANAQIAGGVAAFIDSENNLDPSYAAKLGVNLDELLFSQPDSGEQAFDITERLIDSGKVDIIIVDSVAAMTPKAILEKGWDDKTMAALANLMSVGLAKLKAKVRRTNTILLFTNQLRDKVGQVMPGASPDITPGGRALKFYASVRIDVRRIASVKESASDNTKIGNMTKAKVIKNKVAPPFREAEFLIVFGKGISRAASLISMGVRASIIDKTGSWISYKEQRLGQGELAAIRFLEDNPDLMQKIELEIREKLLPKPTEKDELDDEIGEEDENVEQQDDSDPRKT